MDSNLQKISDSLSQQPSMVINDVKTFQWIRLYHPEMLEKEGLGGGNILSIMGLFSVLNYFSKVYKILKSGKLPRRQIPADINRLTKKLYFVEDQAFLRLLKDCPTKLVDSDKDDDLRSIWNIFRNQLAHTAQISDGSKALVLIQDQTNIPRDILEKFIKNSPEKSFTKIGDKVFICFVDKLIADTLSIRDWINVSLRRISSEDKIKLACDWIENNNISHPEDN